jgi:hypothetical protein
MFAISEEQVAKAIANLKTNYAVGDRNVEAFAALAMLQSLPELDTSPIGEVCKEGNVFKGTLRKYIRLPESTKAGTKLYTAPQPPDVGYGRIMSETESKAAIARLYNARGVTR